ncbi:MAG: methylenetetrahydrofolate--tRNA-(uracil(54)-C(5))-methyltransferase (FADH(2)-oxidizing) TrmFO [Deltaproteobacteria bacterium]|nr:methylenetetrahydrofolate--tRNA-(uracil(54)-C(5))-methyltransferase (FADH(2)-oxidizing) TrmFO [Deltaproteobacteria bacterium]
MKAAIVIGAGLAGSEAAYALAEAGWAVTLYEMRPGVRTPAHQTGNFAELVCSNSFRSDDPENTVGCLKEEMRALGSLTMAVAAEVAVPAGSGLAVDREAFALLVTQRVRAHPQITVRHEEVQNLTQLGVKWDAAAPHAPLIVATGPLTAAALAAEIQQQTHAHDLFFYDSMAPLVATESIDQTKTFRASRYGKGAGNEYINIPLDRAQYETFVMALVHAEKVPPRNFEDPKYFEGCLPVEVMAERGIDTLRHGPMKPMGLRDPQTGKTPYAAVQLRQDNQAGTIYNIVGFQTRMTWTEQRRLFRTLPGLEQAEFLRLGAMHRNTYLNAPKLLNDALALRQAEEEHSPPHPARAARASLSPGGRGRSRNGLMGAIHFAGQIVGVEGYVESAAMGLYVGLRVAGKLQRPPPETTACGSLIRHVTQGNPSCYEPMNANWGLTPPLPAATPYRSRKAAYLARARSDFAAWMKESAVSPDNSIALLAGICQ